MMRSGASKTSVHPSEAAATRVVIVIIIADITKTNSSAVQFS